MHSVSNCAANKDCQSLWSHIDSHLLYRPYNNSSIHAACCKQLDNGALSFMNSGKTPAALTAELLYSSARLVIRSDGGNGVLMHGFEHSVIFRLSFQVHLPEHVQSRFLAQIVQTWSCLGFHRSDNFPPLFTPTQPIRFAILSDHQYNHFFY